MNILVTGANGQLGWELLRLAKSGSEHLMPSTNITALTREELDITSSASIDKAFAHFKPDCLINAAAYTAVDKAEEDEEQAMLINATGPANLARFCRSAGVHLLNVSTDFVFDGNSTKPYHPEDQPNPVSVYGRSKLKGEQAIAEIMDNNWSIIRTAWLYSQHGNNFVKTMLRLMNERPQLAVVSDQIGTPTWARGLAEFCLAACQEKALGVLHWTDMGVASWFDFAVIIQELGLQRGLVKKRIPIAPIATADYPTPAKRPALSVLDKTSSLEKLPAVSCHHWQSQLGRMLDELAAINK